MLFAKLFVIVAGFFTEGTCSPPTCYVPPPPVPLYACVLKDGSILISHVPCEKLDQDGGR